MTAKEAAEVLASLKISGMRSGKTRLAEAMNMAIKALSQDGDIISRQAAIDIVDFECGEWRGLAKTIEQALEQLPSAQPEERTETHACDLVSRQAVFNTVTEYRNQLSEIFGDENELIRVVDIVKHRLIALPSAQTEPCNSHENKVFVDKDAYERCRFEYINACAITHNRTPDTRQSDINDAYAVIKALQPLFGEESF